MVDAATKKKDRMGEIFSKNAVGCTYPITPDHLFEREREWEKFSRDLPSTDLCITAYKLLHLLRTKAHRENGGRCWPNISLDDLRSAGFSRLDIESHIENDGHEWLEMVERDESDSNLNLYRVSELFVLAVFSPQTATW